MAIAILEEISLKRRVGRRNEEIITMEVEANKMGITNNQAEDIAKNKANDRANKYRLKSKNELKKLLNDMQYDVTQNNATEPPFKNEYFDKFEEGIYVDITTGEPLFISTDKFESGCGWPSFSKPITPDLIKELTDTSYGRIRTEVRSKHGQAHLGHVFNDGPKEAGGLRYCINSASLRFIPKAEMEKAGYGELLGLLDSRE